jgi:hypothetical protein
MKTLSTKSVTVTANISRILVEQLQIHFAFFFLVDSVLDNSVMKVFSAHFEKLTN